MSDGGLALRTRPAQPSARSGRPTVLLVTHYFPAHGGGIELVAGQVARRLADAGFRLEWHASDVDPPPAFPGIACRPEPAWNGLERWLGVPVPLWSLPALVRVVRAVGRFDVVHIHDGLYPANFVAALAARWQRKPLVVTQHVGFVPYRSALLRALLALANRVVAHGVLKHADRTLFVGTTVRRYFEGLVGPRASFADLPNGVDAQRFAPADAEQRAALRATLGFPPAAPVLLFVGRRVEKKGLDLIRQLALRTPDWTWCIVGDGPLDPSAWGLANVRTAGRLGQSALVDFYRAADLLVLPSVGEGFPLVVQEALACGLPVAVHTETREAGALDDVVSLAESVHGPDAVGRWFARLQAAFAVPVAEREARRIACRAFAQRWSWEATTEAYVRVLEGR